MPHLAFHLGRRPPGPERGDACRCSRDNLRRLPATGRSQASRRALEDDVVVGLLTSQKLDTSSGRRYLKARRPELYEKLAEPQESVTLPGWKMEHQTQ